MKVNLTSPKNLILFALILTLAIPVLAAVDDFQRSDGALGGNWAANTDMVIQSGRLHNQGVTAGWNSYLAVFNVQNANEASITWPADGNGISGVGAQLGGVAIVNSFSAGSNGYLVYVYGKELRLFELANGSPTGNNLDPNRTVAVNPAAGDKFTVNFNPTTYVFTVSLNGTQIGSIQDAAKRVSMATTYAGVMLYKSAANENDVEAFEAKYVAPVTDNTAPAQITNLAAGSPTSSSITVTWTASGDDGNSGTAASYDLRRSKNNILTATDFTNATRVTIPAPKAAGQSESATVSGLEAATQYFFAIKAIDEAGNTGAMSNVPSATTAESGGGGGDTGQLVWKTDDFERASLGVDWIGANYSISAGELTLTSKINAWNNLAIYQFPGAIGAGLTFSPTNSALYNGSYVPGGLLILMDNANPSSANGYLLKRVANYVDVFRITSGIVASNYMVHQATSQTVPLPGDKVEATITNNGSTKTIKYYTRGLLDATFTISDASPMDNMHAGVALYGGTGFANNLSAFYGGFSGGSGAQSIVVHGGNNQSGPINAQLPQPIQVLVTDENGEPAAGTLLDFQLIQGKASFDDLEDFVFQGQVWQETEAGRLLQPNARIADDAQASGGKYVTYDWIPNETRRKAVAVPFYLPESGRYDLFLRCRTDYSDRYKFYFSLDGAADSTYAEIPRSPLGAWAWVKIGANVAINSGMHDLNLIPYHADLKWDKILVQLVGGSTPSGIGGTGPVFPNMTDADGIGSTRVSFKSDADTAVVVYVYAYRNDGSQVEPPAVFNLDPLPGPAVSMAKDPSIPEPLPATPGFETPPLKVLIKDSFGNGVDGRNITWTVTQGSGTLAAGTTVSDAAGVASNTMTLNFYQSTDYKVTASSVGLTGSPVTFTIRPGQPPQKIVQIQPKTRQTGNVNTVVDSMLIVRILKADNTPFENYPVNFVVSQGGGSICTQGGNENAGELNIVTDVQGYAKAIWTLGGPGLNVVEARAANLQGNPVRFEAFAQTGQPARFTIVSGEAQNGYLGMPLANPFVVKVADANGFPISEIQVDFQIITGQGAYFDQPGVTKKTAYTSTSGEASVTLTLGSTLNEAHLVRATAVGTGLAAIDFHATPVNRIAKSITYISGNGIGGVYQSAVVTNALTSAFVVKAVDPYGSPVSGQSVIFRSISGGGTFAGVAEVTKQTNAQGEANATLTLGTQAGDSAYVVHAIANRVDLPAQALAGSPVIFKATGLPKSATKIVRVDSTNNQNGEVGLPLAKPIQVKVTDEYFNPIKNHNVTFTVRANGGELEDPSGKAPSKTVKTGNNGVASVIWHMPATPSVVYTDAAGTKTTGGPLEGSPVEFAASAAAGRPHQMTRITVDSVLVGKVWKPLVQKLKVKITDRLGNPLVGIPVMFEVKAGGGLVNGVQVANTITADSGFTSVTWQLGKKSGVAVNTVHATASVTVNPTIIFRATGTPDVAFRLVADSSYTTYGKVGELLPDPIKTQIVDQFGNGVAKQVVDFAIVPVGSNSGYIKNVGQTTAKDTSDENGYTEVRWGLGSGVGSQNNKLRATAQVNQVHLVNSPYTYLASAQVGGPARLVRVTPDTNLTSVIHNTLPEFLRVRVTDASNNPVSQIPVRFEVKSRNEANGGTLDGSVDSVKTKSTDSNGEAWVQFTLGGNAGYKINKVEVRAENPTTKLPLSGSPLLFEITGIATSATAIALVDGNNQIGSVGEFVPRSIQVAATDNHGNRVKNQPIRFRIVPKVPGQTEGIGALGPGAAIDTSVNTNANGLAIIQWRLGHAVGKYMVEASSFGLNNSPIMLSATGKADKTDPLASTITVSPAQLTVSNGETRATVTVTLKDTYGNPVSGRAVSLLLSGENNLITQPADTTNANGRAIGYVASRTAEVKYISARDMNGGVTLPDSAAQITFNSAAASRMLKAPVDNGDGQSRNIGTVLEKPLKALVTDAFGNPKANIAVTFTATSGGGAMVDNQPTYTDAQGIASARYRLGMNVAANLVAASSPGLTGSPVNFTALAENPQQISRLEILSGNYLTANPGQDLPEPLRVRVLDVQNRPVYGKRTRFDVMLNNPVVTSENPLNSDMFGEAQVRAQVGTAVGLNIIRASLEDLPNISATFYDTTKVSTGTQAAALLVYAGNNQSNAVGQTLPVPLTVLVVDPWNNPVPGETVRFEVFNDQSVEGSGTLEGGVKVLAKESNAQGFAQVYYTLGTQSGLNKIRASVPDLSQVFTHFEVYGLSTIPYQMRKWSGDNQTGEMGRDLLKPISVLVTDMYGNPASSGRVNFVVLTGGGSIVEAQPILSGENGIAQVHWKLGPRPNAYVNQVQVVAQLTGGTFTETFTATGDAAYWPNLQMPREMWVRENEIVSFNVSANGSDNPPILCTAEKMPDSTAVFVNNGDGTWTFSWRPDFNAVKSPATNRPFYAVFRATDTRGGMDLDSVKVNVSNMNRTPQITRFWPAIDLIKVVPGSITQQQFGVETFDQDSDALTVTWYVDDAQVATGYTWTMNMNQYPPYKYYTVHVLVVDAPGARAHNYWGVKVPVELTSFAAEVSPYEGIKLAWETANEFNSAGFNVLRSLKQDGEFVKVNEKLIPSSSNGRYDYLDSEIAAGRTYYYKVENVSIDGTQSVHGPVKAEAPVPKDFKLAQNFPNPFNPSTTIRFDVPQVAQVKLEIYNVLGQKVRTLIDRQMDPGYHEMIWDSMNDQGMRVSSGVYYYRITAGDFNDVKKMALLK